MKEPTIKVDVSGTSQLIQITIDQPLPGDKVALAQALFDVVKAHLPKPPEPGEAAQAAYVSHSRLIGSRYRAWPELVEYEKDAWIAAEAAAREGYVSKADVRDALESLPERIESRDVIGVISNIRELVK